jgi:4-amino-4-deoxy-L-arabinose transferase-like glycosyltransferase
MVYLVAAIYGLVGRNMLAVQFFNAVVGAATAPVIFLCARHIFQNVRVAKLAAVSVAFYPSLVLWSSQGLKDGPIVFLLALTMLATLKLGERLSARYMLVLLLAMLAILSLRFYIFYMVAAAVCGAFVIGMRPLTTQSLARQVTIVLVLGLGFTYFGVLRTAGAQYELFGSLEGVQRSRADLARSANTGFGNDVDVSTASGALSVVPLGMAYLLFAPFPWQLASLRQSITLPEMIAWWAAFPLLVLGVWFTLSYRMRQALPILLFTTMLTLAYSIFQGNVGTAYRQRSQILVFYFIFVAVGAVLLKERHEERRLGQRLRRQAAADAVRVGREPARARLAPPLDMSRPRVGQTHAADTLTLKAGH